MPTGSASSTGSSSTSTSPSGCSPTTRRAGRSPGRSRTLRAPLPEDLVPRARLIHERQLVVADALTRRASSTAQQLALTRQDAHPGRPRRPGLRGPVRLTPRRKTDKTAESTCSDPAGTSRRRTRARRARPADGPASPPIDVGASVSPFASDPVVAVLSTALDGVAFRQSVIANNIANVDTPGFRAGSVDFETSLKAAISDGSLFSGQPGAVPDHRDPDADPGRGEQQQRGPPQGDDGGAPVHVPVPDAQPRHDRPLRDDPHRGGGVLMGAFDMLAIANTSLGMHQTWLDALANNIANINTARPDVPVGVPGPDGDRPGPAPTAPGSTSPASR